MFFVQHVRLDPITTLFLNSYSIKAVLRRNIKLSSNCIIIIVCFFLTWASDSLCCSSAAGSELLLTGTRKRARTTPVLLSLLSLPVYHRIELKFCLVLRIFMVGPRVFTVYELSCLYSNSRRLKSGKQLNVGLIIKGGCVFAVVSPTLWNNLRFLNVSFWLEISKDSLRYICLIYIFKLN